MPNAATNNNYEISMENIRSMPPTSYFGTKILFVISGSLTVNCTARDYKLQAHDILILNRNVRHEMSSNEDNIVIVLSLTAQFFAQHDKSYFSYHFDCFSREMDRGREQMVAGVRDYAGYLEPDHYAGLLLRLDKRDYLVSCCRVPGVDIHSLQI